jgi:hypothetical protein
VTPNAAKTSQWETSRVHARIALCNHAKASTANTPPTASWNNCLSVSQNRAKPRFSLGGALETKFVTAMYTSYRIGSTLICLAFLAGLYGWSVNRLETTPAVPLVSNLSQSYNRN